MKLKEIKIWPADERVGLAYCGGKAGEPALLVLPGGGYNICAPSEGEVVAEHFAGRGYNAYVLNYSTRFGSFENYGGEANPHTLFPEPMREVAAAAAYIRGVQGAVPLVILGFSAGGHLAACYSSLWNSAEVCGGIAEDAEILRPDVCVLGYGATEPGPDSVMMKAVYGEKEHYSEEEIHRYMPKELINEGTPPTFLFHSITDPMVPVRQSVDYAQSLAEHGIAHEVHLFGCGGHAYGLGTGGAAGQWPELADRFIKQVLASPLEYDKVEVKRLSEGRRRSHRPGRP